MIQGKKVQIDGILFDSQLEAGRYIELSAMQKAGEISGLICHPKWDLIEKPALLPDQVRIVAYNGKKITNAVTFEADFAYLENGKQIIEDVKAKIHISKKGKSNRKYVLKEAWIVRFKIWHSIYGAWNEFRIIFR